MIIVARHFAGAVYIDTVLDVRTLGGFFPGGGIAAVPCRASGDGDFHRFSRYACPGPSRKCIVFLYRIDQGKGIRVRRILLRILPGRQSAAAEIIGDGIGSSRLFKLRRVGDILCDPDLLCGIPAGKDVRAPRVRLSDGRFPAVIRHSCAVFDVLQKLQALLAVFPLQRIRALGIGIQGFLYFQNKGISGIGSLGDSVYVCLQALRR